MAAPWIKMRSDLAEDPATIGIARRVGLDVDTVVGKLHRVWSMADRQSANGQLPELTLVSIDECARCEKFGAAMVEVGWLTVYETGLELPNFERHNGKSAKRRALNAVYQVSTRSAKSQHGKLTKCSPEKRRRDTPPVVPHDTNTLFERFWHAYPKKRAKGDALKAWRSLKPSPELVATILEVIEQHKLTHDWAKDGGRFIPYPATWIRGRRWEDQLAVPPPKQAGNGTDATASTLAPLRPNAEVHRLRQIEAEIARERRTVGDGDTR